MSNKVLIFKLVAMVVLFFIATPGTAAVYGILSIYIPLMNDRNC